MNEQFKRLITPFPQWIQQLKNGYQMSIAAFFGNGKNVSQSWQLIIQHYQEIKVQEKHKLKGIYVLWENGEPIYVGISRHLIQRLRQHHEGKGHNSASFAYKLAKEKVNPVKMSRDEFCSKYGTAFLEAKERISKMTVTILPVEDDYQLYMFEVYASLELKTRYNDFRTHLG